MAGNEKSEAVKSGKLMQVVVFRLGGEEYGMLIDQIKEVVITPTITRMPQSPKFIKGVANVRGNVIAILDLEERFNLERGLVQNGGGFTLVVESDELKMGLLVSEVPNTISVNASEIDTTVGIVGDSNVEGNYVKGVIKTGKRLIILIDIFKVVDQEAVTSLKRVHQAA